MIQRVFADELGERKELIVVQCKHFAHSGRNVKESDIGIFEHTLTRFDAQGYLLVTSTNVTEGVNDLFLAFSKAGNQTAAFWNSAKLIELLNRHPKVRDCFFPKDTTRTTRSSRINEVGWGIIFPAQERPGIYEALKPLLDRRKAQAKSGSGLYQEFRGSKGYQPGEDYQKFLTRNGIALGAPDPHQVPYFLTLIGDAHEIPFSFQSQLGIQYAVGRLAFDEILGYANYAKHVHHIETSQEQSAKNLTLFAPAHERDPVTEHSAKFASKLRTLLTTANPDWKISLIHRGLATKKKLLRLLGINSTPSTLLFIVTHGVIFPLGHEKRTLRSGGIVTADWPGPTSAAPLTRACYLCAEDIGADANLGSSILFLFGCGTAGVSTEDHGFTYRIHRDSSGDFVSALPKRLLSLPEGGALALIGHVGRSWMTSFYQPDLGYQQNLFKIVLSRLMREEPAGVAMQILTQYYAELAASVAVSLAQPQADEASSELLELWNRVLDARN